MADNQLTTRLCLREDGATTVRLSQPVHMTYPEGITLFNREARAERIRDDGEFRDAQRRESAVGRALEQDGFHWVKGHVADNADGRGGLKWVPGHWSR
jgi:hypothetical protein